MRSLALKLTLAFLLVSLIGTAVVAIFARQATTDAFDSYVWEQERDRFIQDATAYYQTHRSWQGVAEHFRRLVEARPQQPGAPLQAPPRQPPFLLADLDGQVLVPVPPYRIGGRISRSEMDRGIPIEVEGESVGLVVATGQPPERDPTQERYLAYTNRALLIAALVAITIGVLLGVLLARTMTRPVTELTAATQAVADGELEQEVPIRSQDELGELAAAFNQMSADLARANELRRQMTADIAHDLRTPLTVITGYLESLRDGVLQPTPERFETMYNEAHHLRRLVEDLRTLSLADAGELALNRQLVAPGEFLERILVAFQQEAEGESVELRLQVEPDLAPVYVDPERMVQVLGNLVGNALRYTPAGGQITLSAQRQAESLLLTVQDDGAGISQEALPHIFDRFYRGDETRQQQRGESGLGLAIAKSLVEAHGGRIAAYSEGIGRGSTFSIYLPQERDGPELVDIKKRQV